MNKLIAAILASTFLIGTAFAESASKPSASATAASAPAAAPSASASAPSASSNTAVLDATGKTSKKHKHGRAKHTKKMHAATPETAAAPATPEVKKETSAK